MSVYFNKIFFNLIIFLFLINSFFNEFIYSISPNFSNQISIILISLVALSTLINIKFIKINKLNLSLIILLFLMIISVIFTMLLNNLFSETIIKFVMYHLIFIFIILNTNLINIDVLKNTLFLTTLILIISIFLSIGKVQYSIVNLRNYTIVDKVIYTLVFTLYTIYLFNFSKYRKKYFNLFMLLLIFFTSVFIIQSKTYLLIFLIYISFYINLKINTRFIKYLLIIALLIIFILIYITGIFSFFISDYEISLHINSIMTRLNIWYESIALLQYNILFGLGQVKFSYNEINQYESGYVTFLLNFGLIYFILHIALIFWILKLKFKYKKEDYYEQRFITSSLIIAIIVLNIFNEFYGIYYWIILGIILFIKERESKINENTPNKLL